MIKTVLDTNVLVSALLVAESNPARILGMALNGNIMVCYDSRILLEYKAVLTRPKFPFRERDVNALIDTLTRTGASIIASPSNIHFVDATDKKFYEVAQSVGAYLITGNGKHYPDDNCVLSPAEFLSLLMT